MNHIILIILFSILAMKCQAEINFESCIPQKTTKPSKREKKLISEINELLSSTSFSDIKKHQKKYGDDSCNAITLLMSPMSSSNIDEISILELAKTKYLSTCFSDKRQRKEVINGFLAGDYYGFDGSLFNLVLSTPQASFLLYEENHIIQANDIHKENGAPIGDSVTSLLNLIINDETTGYFKNNNKHVHMPLRNLQKHSAIEIADTYKENEVKGNLKFKRKRFSVYGVVDEVGVSIDDKPMVYFRNKDQFQRTVAIFNARVTIEKIAEIKKDKQLNLICSGEGSIAGSPLLSDCVFFDDYLREQWVSINNNHTLSPTYDTKNLLLATELIASILPANSACFNGNSIKCKTEIFNLPIKSIQSAAVTYGLRRENVKGSVRTMINQFNEVISSDTRYSKEQIKKHIERNEICFVPTIMKIF